MTPNNKFESDDGAATAAGNRMRIAILEDDPDQADIVSLWLQDAGYSVTTFLESPDFLRSVRRHSFDLYLLDWVVPEFTGVEVLRKLRGEMNDATPAIMATVKNSEQSVVRALEVGADDFTVKPIKRAELLARIAALLRRVGGGQLDTNSLDLQPYEIDTEKKSISLNKKDITLTNREFGLAALLFHNAGKLLSRSHILEAIWGIDNSGVSTRTVDTHVSRLRKKLQLNTGNGWRLVAVYQQGYRIERESYESDSA